MIFEHYASEPREIDAREYIQAEDTPYDKPNGFWISVKGQDDWPSWCISEQFAEERLKYRHRVTLQEGHNIKILNNEKDIDLFEESYSTEFGSSSISRHQMMVIRWPLVASLYDGILIPRYLWSMRFRNWYYGWDCASGCVWNTDVIRIESVEESGIVFPVLDY